MSKEHIKRWLTKAHENLRVAESATREGFYSAACFHSQQAAELALKGLILHKLGIQPLTHSLTELAERVSEVEQLSLPSLEDLRWLQDHYLQARYPNARLSEYSRDEAERALRIAKKVLEEVAERVR